MGQSIVFTVTTDLNHDQRMIRIADTLAQAGYEVTLVGRELPHSSPLKPRRYTQHRLSCFFKKGPLFYLEYNLRLIFWLIIHRFQIYGTIDADTALAGVVTTWWRKRPLVFDAHELFPEMPEVTLRPKVKRIWAFLEKLAFRRAHAAYTVSASLVQYFEKRYHRPVGLVRNMPFLQPYPALSKTDQAPYFIYQGALNVGRGLENVIKAMQEVPAQLMICGDGPLAGSLRELVNTLGLHHKVVFKGNVEPSELAKLTQKAYAGIMLLDNQGLSYYYSLANKFFDYVQAGIPQVCVPFPEYQHINAEHEVALLVENELPQVKAALLTLLQDHACYANLVQNCLQARQVWNWEQEGCGLVQIFRELEEKL